MVFPTTKHRRQTHQRQTPSTGTALRLIFSPVVDQRIAPLIPAACAIRAKNGRSSGGLTPASGEISARWRRIQSAGRSSCKFRQHAWLCSKSSLWRSKDFTCRGKSRHGMLPDRRHLRSFTAARFDRFCYICAPISVSAAMTSRRDWQLQQPHTQWALHVPRATGRDCDFPSRARVRLIVVAE